MSWEWIDDRRRSEWRREWPERAAWTAFAAGWVGVLLVSLLIVVETWRPPAAAQPASGVVHAEARAQDPSRAER